MCDEGFQTFTYFLLHLSEISLTQMCLPTTMRFRPTLLLSLARQSCHLLQWSTSWYSQIPRVSWHCRLCSLFCRSIGISTCTCRGWQTDIWKPPTMQDTEKRPSSSPSLSLWRPQLLRYLRSDRVIGLQQSKWCCREARTEQTSCDRPGSLRQFSCGAISQFSSSMRQPLCRSSLACFPSWRHAGCTLRKSGKSLWTLEAWARMQRIPLSTS